MPLARGLRKLFTRHKRFTAPHHYRLTAEEWESVMVFFSILVVALLGGMVIFYLH